MKLIRPCLPIFIIFSIACKKPQPVFYVNVGADYKKGEVLVYQQPDSAFYYFNKVVTASKDSLQIAMAYNYMGMIQSGAGDYFGSQESLLTSLKYLDENDERDFECISGDYNELGLTGIELKQYTPAVANFKLAIKYAKNPSYKLVFLNNLALAYQKKGNYTQAISLYNQSLSQTTDDKERARLTSNLAKSRWLKHENYLAAPEMRKALEIRVKLNDKWGQNASFSHLSDYYAKRNSDSSRYFATKMLAVASSLGSPDDELEALNKLIRLSEPISAKNYFLRYQRLNDSLQTARNSAKNQFAMIRYQAEKNKAENLKLQKENSDKNYRIIWQQVVLYGGLVLVSAGVCLAFFWYKKRRQRIEMEAQHAIRSHQLETSKRIHDVVANGLYRIMSEVENRKELDKESLLDKIEALYERSRDVSYEITPKEEGNITERIADIVLSFGNSDTKVILSGNDERFWERTTMAKRYELEQILQELMVNMDKHSKAKNVVIKFEQFRDHLRIIYHDDGLGFSEGMRYKNGLTNTGNRIKLIGGNITFESEAGKGLHVQIVFPLEKT